MGKPQVAPYGSWTSPISARLIAEGMIGLGGVCLDAGRVYWDELRPTEGGRNVVVRRDGDGGVGDAIPAGFSARTRVHEYGGGAYVPCGEGLVFVNFADQRLYRCAGQGEPEPITREPGVRYADLVRDTARSRLIAVREDHRGDGEAVNTLAAVYCHEGGRAEVLVAGNDFYAAPRVSPDGSHLAWLTWNHPNMPWDAAELWVAPILEGGSIGAPAHVAGGPGESAAQPLWSPDGVLHFVCDRTGWYNLYRRRGGRVEPLAPMEAEFAGAQWRFGMSNYGFDGPGRLICAYVKNARSRLAALDTATGRLDEIQTPYTTIGQLSVSDGRAAFVGGASGRPTAVVWMDLAAGESEELRRSSEHRIDAGYLSAPESIEFATENGLTAHGLFYPPRNGDHVGPAGEKPPLLVTAHGGPTGATSTAFAAKIQYYTSRGFAVLDVNYGGSTGYGRAYRERLYGQWGVVDVDDCCNGAKHLVERGRVDPHRLAITGGSAGGYTTLSVLTFREVFAAGASHFGVSDCELLATETHKFESRYLDRLIGPYPARRDLYIERSPIHHLDRLSRPVIFFQGLEDRIVLPNQARLMADALRKKGLPVALVEFAGEQHGFRQAEHIQRALEGEFYFFSRVFGFEPADTIEPVEIENLGGD